MKKQDKSKIVRRRNLLPAVVLCVGFIAGVALIGFGIYNNATSDYSVMAIRSEDDLKNDVNSKIEEVKNLREERDEEYNNSALSDKYYEISRNITATEGELADLEAELYNVQNGVYDSLKSRTISDSVPLIIFGIALIIFGAGLYSFLKNHEKRNKILSINEA